MSRQWAFEDIVRKEANHLLRTFVDGAANGSSEPKPAHNRGSVMSLTEYLNRCHACGGSLHRRPNGSL